MNLLRHLTGCLVLFAFHQAFAETPEEFYAKGDAAIEVGHYDEAIDDLTKAIEAHPDFAKAYWLRAFAKTQKEQYDASLADLNKAVELNPNSAILFNNRGDVYRLKKDYDQAIADFTTSLKLEKMKQTYDLRGFCYRMKNDFDKAIQDYDRCIELDNRYEKAYFNRGIAYNHKKDYAHAIEDLNKAISLDPMYNDAYDALAWIYATCPDFTVRDGKKATQYALKAIQTANGQVPGYYLGDLAVAYAEDKNFPQAMENIQKCLANPNLGKEDRERYTQVAEFLQAGKPYRNTQ